MHDFHVEVGSRRSRLIGLYHQVKGKKLDKRWREDGEVGRPEKKVKVGFAAARFTERDRGGGNGVGGAEQLGTNAPHNGGDGVVCVFMQRSSGSLSLLLWNAGRMSAVAWPAGWRAHG